ncbi:hypothetical protein HOE22_06420 [Candidatus Woesearchaeota archaeon]|jgi:hypothetical protein|nr:hypothetical protein [Candidatus Woesearchaeota archaeon]MBT4731508.1 hypothetical protein [Candidatus Woesearchaeota archaeon]
MAGRFLPSRDLDLFTQVNKELIGDLKEGKDGIINQQVVLYKISAHDTMTNMYGESSGGKRYKTGVKFACLIESEDMDFNTDEFGSDMNQNTSFHILRQILIDLTLVPEIGDIIEWNFTQWEINSIVENQLVGGMQDNNFSVTCVTHLIRESNLGMNRVRSI